MDEKQITNLERYTELKSYLVQLADRASKFTAPDKEVMKELQVARKFLTETGLALRSGYTAKAKEVSAVEKLHLEIIEKEEKRLKQLKEEADKAIEVEYRKSQFDARNAKMATIGLDIDPDSNVGMDDVQFEQFFQQLVAEMNAKKQAELEARERKIREAEEAQEREAKQKEREEQIRKEAREKAERDIEEANARAARAEKDAQERAEEAERTREREAREQKEAQERKDAEEKKKLEADAMYQAFLEGHGWNASEDFMVERKDGKILLYKLVGTLDLE